MNIVILGTSSLNKGAELMLYAILQEIENRFPDAVVFLQEDRYKEGLSYINTSLTLKPIPKNINKIRVEIFVNKLRLSSLFKKMGIWGRFFVKGLPKIDYLFDASGLLFTDQLKAQWALNRKEEYCYLFKSYKKQGTKVVLLPQLFGPFESEASSQQVRKLVSVVDVAMAREEISYKYLVEAAPRAKNIVKFTDFTSLVKGNAPIQYSHLSGAVCVIPNMQMVNKGVLSMEEYVHLLEIITKKIMESGKNVFLLNHEGIKDEECAYKIQERLSRKIEVVSGLNAIEVKGMIASSYMCISSRFHGVASALNSAVPCLATSWSHKYSELFKDYELDDCVLQIKDEASVLRKVGEYLDKENNQKIHQHLLLQQKKIHAENNRMWEYIWNL